MREILRIDLDGEVLFGTRHIPAVDVRTPSLVGALIFNTGYGPRSSGSDLSVRLADRLSELGYDVFRFDMPGLGDSPGDLPEYVDSFARFVQEGGHVGLAQSLIAHLKWQFNLSGFVLAGNCGGAITATYTAIRKPEDVLGLVQLDPDFEHVEEFDDGSAISTGGSAKPKSRGSGLFRTLRGKLREFPALKKAVRTPYKTLRFLTMNLRDMTVGVRLPRKANKPLLASWERVAATELPILVLTSSSYKGRVAFFDYLGYLMARCSHKVTAIEIEGTNHLFTSGGGIATVLDRVERWMLENVPPNSPSPQSNKTAESLSATECV
jgi:pimeloyl-ACP methyl ester carboxylesterase